MVGLEDTEDFCRSSGHQGLSIGAAEVRQGDGIQDWIVVMNRDGVRAGEVEGKGEVANGIKQDGLWLVCRAGLDYMCKSDRAHIEVRGVKNSP